MTRISAHRGKVYLVGAGPGDPGLITVRGQEVLRQADVVVYDALIDTRLLDLAPPHARRIDAGKRAKAHTLSQDQINELLVQEGQQGHVVVRLKGGDPYLFGRGGEEVSYLARHGVPCEVVPGVTAGIAAPAAAGIPVTHRSIASTVTFVTGHEDPGKSESNVDYASLAGLVRSGGTVCFYMGVGRLGSIAGELMRQGLGEGTPVAVVEWGTTARQRSLRTTLGRGAADVAAAGLGAPAIIVVGQVAALNEPGLDYFARRPLFGRCVVITRTRHQASDLRRRLEELGAWVLEAPTIELAEPSAGWGPVDEAIRRLGEYHWLILTSVNGVEALAERLEHLGLDARRLGDPARGGVRVAAIGDATAEALRTRLGVRADLVPMQFVAESLGGELIAEHGVRGRRCLLLRADIARPVLPRMLAEAGAYVTELAVYETRRPAALPVEVLEALRIGRVDWVTFTSSSTATNMVDLLGDEWSLLRQVKIASIGPITSQTLRGLNLEPTVEAGTSNIAGLVEAVLAAEQASRESRAAGRGTGSR